jgi:UDP-3-O-[3-hydroxymyristoyl] glucosamine N-acyltransferase
MIIDCEMIAEYMKARKLDFEVNGDNICVKRISALGPDVKESICYYTGKDKEEIKGIKNSIIFCYHGFDVDHRQGNTFIFTSNPQLCLYHVSSLFEEKEKSRIHNMSVINPDAIIGENVSIGPFCTIEACMIGNHVSIDSGVKIHKAAIIGNGVYINSNSVIGEAGIMWTSDNKNRKICLLQTGKVIIEDNVYIGSCVRLVRGAFANMPTVIEKNTMIANGTAIGHGGFIGENSHLGNNVTLSGSVRIGKDCFLGSGCTIRPHVIIPDNTIVGAGAVVIKSYSKKGIILVGNPARELITSKRKLTGVPQLL